MGGVHALSPLFSLPPSPHILTSTMPPWTQYIPLVAAVSGSVAASASTGVPLRKSLSFGPQLPHAAFTTQPQVAAASLQWSNDKKSAFKYAEEYAQAFLGHPEGSFRIRDDSYFDATTGIWHVYLRQVTHDGTIEVADGDINLNIRNGQVISYGDSVRLFRPCLSVRIQTFN